MDPKDDMLVAAAPAFRDVASPMTEKNNVAADEIVLTPPPPPPAHPRPFPPFSTLRDALDSAPQAGRGPHVPAPPGRPTRPPPSPAPLGRAHVRPPLPHPPL